MVFAYNMVKKAYDEGYALGLSEARAAIRRQITVEYFKRMQQAYASGKEFREPPPRVEPAYLEGFVDGRSEAYADANKQLAAYYKRMQEAHARGEDFTEPPPIFGASDIEEQD